VTCSPADLRYILDYSGWPLAGSCYFHIPPVLVHSIPSQIFSCKYFLFNLNAPSIGVVVHCRVIDGLVLYDHWVH
jgi:hypothetical protein